jgi:hypothetical protein
MGGAIDAVVEDVTCLEFNPAGLGGIHDNEIAYMHSFWAQDLGVDQLAFGLPLSSGWGGAIGVDYVNFGSVDKINIVGGAPQSAGSYSPMGLNLSTGVGGRLMENLMVGGVAKFLFQNIQINSSATVALDAGLLYWIPKTGLSFSAVLNNLGGTLDTDALPLETDLGASWSSHIGNETFQSAPKARPVYANFLTLSTEGDIALYDTGFSNFRVGAEYWHNRQIALRAGYRFAPYGDLSGTRGLAAGIGVLVIGWEVSYALTTQGDMGTTNQISLMDRF